VEQGPHLWDATVKAQHKHAGIRACIPLRVTSIDRPMEPALPSAGVGRGGTKEKLLAGT